MSTSRPSVACAARAPLRACTRSCRPCRCGQECRECFRARRPWACSGPRTEGPGQRPASCARPSRSNEYVFLLLRRSCILLYRMPELPDITVYLEALDSRILNRTLEHIQIAGPSLLRTADPAPQAAEGHAVTGLRRIGKRIAIGFDNGVW